MWVETPDWTPGCSSEAVGSDTGEELRDLRWSKYKETDFTSFVLNGTPRGFLLHREVSLLNQCEYCFFVFSYSTEMLHCDSRHNSEWPFCLLHVSQK